MAQNCMNLPISIGVAVEYSSVFHRPYNKMALRSAYAYFKAIF